MTDYEKAQAFIDNSLMGQRVREVLKYNNYSQSFVAKELHLSQSVVSSLISGKHRPNYIFFYRLASFLGVSMDYLLGFSDVVFTKHPVENTEGFDETLGWVPRTKEVFDKDKRVELINNSHIESSVISHMYSGERVPPHSFFAYLALKYNVSTDYLFCLTNENKLSPGLRLKEFRKME